MLQILTFIILPILIWCYIVIHIVTIENKKTNHDPEVKVSDDGSTESPVVRVTVGDEVIDLTTEQAKNLWGELGSQLRKIKKLKD